MKEWSSQGCVCLRGSRRVTFLTGHRCADDLCPEPHLWLCSTSHLKDRTSQLQQLRHYLHQAQPDMTEDGVQLSSAQQRPPTHMISLHQTDSKQQTQENSNWHRSLFFQTHTISPTHDDNKSVNIIRR